MFSGTEKSKSSPEKAEFPDNIVPYDSVLSEMVIPEVLEVRIALTKLAVLLP